MSAIGWLLERIEGWRDRPAVIGSHASATYGDLADRVFFWSRWLRSRDYGVGDVIALQADYSLESVAVLLALLDAAAIVLPLAPTVTAEATEFYRIAEGKAAIHVDESGRLRVAALNSARSHPLLKTVADRGVPGLILMSSGSTGKPKASLHDASRFLKKFQRPRSALRTIAVPPMDHVAGLDTLFYCLSSGGVLVCVANREPSTVCRMIQTHGVELLPASAAFLNLLIISGSWRDHDISCLRMIAYGSDVMPPSTLQRLKEILPGATFIQKYGTTEIGSPRTRPKESGSLWVTIDDEGYETKIVEGTLWIRAQSAMLGYLNAPNPFEADGWINTGDAVEVDGEYLRILGRKSELINVGGHKVYPAEIETVLLQMDNVYDAVVFGSANPLMGQVVGARVALAEAEDYETLKRRVREYCKERLASYKIPVVIEVTESSLVTARQKKIRSMVETEA